MERQAGGKTRGMGEKQIEVDKRLLRLRMAQLRRQIEEVSCSCTYRLRAMSSVSTDTAHTLLLIPAWMLYMQVRRHRKQHRERRADMLLPVISLVGYTNAGAHSAAGAV